MPTKAQRLNTENQRVRQVATCRTCKAEKSWSEFNPSPTRRPFGLTSVCSACDLIRKAQVNKKWRARQTKEILQETDRRKNLKKFGLTLDEYNQMFASQKGLCGICNQPETDIHPRTKKIQNLAVDHCHKTGKNRKLLCSKCNKGLGCFKDNVEYLENAIRYLKEARDAA